LITLGACTVEDDISGILKKALVELQEMLPLRVPKVKSISGPCVGSSEQQYFNASSCNISDLPDFIGSISPTSVRSKYVNQRLLEFTDGIMGNELRGTANGKELVRIPAIALIRTIISHFVPNVQFFENTGGDDNLKTCYDTTIHAVDGPIKVRGNTDLVVYIAGAPVAVVKVNSLEETCNPRGELQSLGDLLAANQGFAEQYRDWTGVQPRFFPSVLVSGRYWLFVDRAFRDGHRQLVHPVLETFKTDPDNRNVINQENVMLVSRLLVRMTFAISNSVRAVFERTQDVYDFASGAPRKEESDAGGSAADEMEAQGDAESGAGGASSGDDNSQGEGRPSAAVGGKRALCPSVDSPRKRSRHDGGVPVHSNLTVENVFRHNFEAFSQKYGWH
jgi:hypothetical protein